MSSFKVYSLVVDYKWEDFIRSKESLSFRNWAERDFSLVVVRWFWEESWVLVVSRDWRWRCEWVWC